MPSEEEIPQEGHHPTDGSFAASSPITDGQRLFAYFGSRGLFCYDLTGKLQWSQNFGDMHIAMGFGEGSSPALSGDILLVNRDHEGESFIVALDKRTGKTLWKTAREERTSWATPIVIEHNGKAQVITVANERPFIQQFFHFGLGPPKGGTPNTLKSRRNPFGVPALAGSRQGVLPK